jgi:hypothetical protein
LASFALLPQATRRVDELLELTADVEVAYSDLPDLPAVAAWKPDEPGGAVSRLTQVAEQVHGP